MPSEVKLQREESVGAALNASRKRGFDAVTARDMAKELEVSVSPIFTCFDSMEQLRAEISRPRKAGLY